MGGTKGTDIPLACKDANLLLGKEAAQSLPGALPASTLPHPHDPITKRLTSSPTANLQDPGDPSDWLVLALK